MKLAAWICVAPVLLYAQPVTITGIITNAATHEPIPGVTVRLFGSNDIRELSTDERGTFRASGMENCCRVLFDKEGFAAVGSSNFQFQASVNGPPLNLTMLPWPALRGRVLDPERRPLPGSTIEAIGISSRPKITKTGSDGAFSFEHTLPPGDYVLLATPPPSNAAASTTLAPTYFPDAADRDTAAKLTLKAGGELSGYDLIVRQVPQFRITGKVVDERGEPAAGAILQAPTAAAKVTADDTGRFQWNGVRPGSAVVQADWNRDGFPLRAFTPITVGQRDLEDLTLRVSPSVTISGTVELDGKPAEVDGSASLEPVNGNGSAARAIFRPSGLRFDVVFPGRYRLKVFVSTGFTHSMYLDSVRMGDLDLTVDEFEVTPNPQPFRVILKTGGGRVSGTVRDGAGGIVVLVPREGQQWAADRVATTFFRGGLFQVENVRPGNYHAFAVRGVFNHGQLDDPDCAARLLSAAQPVRVDHNMTATVTLEYVDVPASH